MTHIQDKGCLDTEGEEGEQVGGSKQDGRHLVVTEQHLHSKQSINWLQVTIYSHEILDPDSRIRTSD